jgi:hypothetical protein
MPKFRVWTEQINANYYDVDADTKDEAVMLVQNRRVYLLATYVIQLDEKPKVTVKRPTGRMVELSD